MLAGRRLQLLTRHTEKGAKAAEGKEGISAFFFLSLFIYLERHRGSVNGGGAEREGEETESQAGSESSAQSPMWGSNS